MGMVSTLNPMNKEHEPKAHSQLPPGFRFHPTDEELVNYYLTRKILDSNFSGCAIGEADFNKCEPWDLLANAKIGEKEWYFFGLQDRKYPKGHRTNRATEAGYWKTTGKDREVFRSRSSELVGMKITMVFYKGRARKGEKTNWVMHEYRLESKFSNHHLPENCNLDEWVVCRIFQKSAGGIVNRSAYLDKPASPSLPPLLESAYKTAAANDQETRTSESESVSSAKVDEVSCCSKPTEPMTNSTEHHLQQFECGSRCNYTDSSVQLSEMSRFMKHSSYMHNLNPRIYMNMVSASALFSVSNMMRDQISAQLDQQPGIQQLPDLTPSIRYKTDIPLPSNFSNMGVSTHAYFSALHFSKALVCQSAGSPLQPYSSSSVHDKELSNNNTVEANNSVNSFQMANFCQNLLAQTVVGNIAEGDLRTTDMNNEMTSVVCNRMDQPLDPLDYSAARSWDFDSLWNIEDHLF